MTDRENTYSILLESLCERLADDPVAMAKAVQAVNDCAGLLIYIHKASRRVRIANAVKGVVHLPEPIAVNKLQAKFSVSRRTAYRWLSQAHANA